MYNKNYISPGVRQELEQALASGNAGEILTAPQAVKLLGERIRKGDAETLRAAEDRARHFVKRYADSHREIVLGELVAAGRMRWPGRLMDFPAIINRSLAESMHMCDTMTADKIPGDEQEYKRDLAQAQRRIRTLVRERGEARAQSAANQWDADRYREIAKRNRTASRKPRR